MKNVIPPITSDGESLFGDPRKPAAIGSMTPAENSFWMANFKPGFSNKPNPRIAGERI